MRTELLEPMSVPPRAVADLLGPDQRLLLAMPALSEDLSIAKLVSVRTGIERDLLSSTVLAMDPSGSLLAIIDGEELTARRTAAASLLAAQLMLRRSPRTLAVLGAGRQARALATAYCRAFPVKEVRIWARRREAAVQLARTLPMRTIICRDADKAVTGADLITSATPSTSPLIQDAFVRPHAHIDLVGGFRPTMREADDALIARALIVADGPAALMEAGDLAGPLAEGLIDKAHIAFLVDVLRSGRVGSDDQPTLFKSVGHAGEDLIAVRLLLERIASA
jgi:ornithine cyclodeaminase